MQLRERELNTLDIVVKELGKIRQKLGNVIDVGKVFQKPI